MTKLIAISTGVEDVTMSPGEIKCSVLNMNFIHLCNKYDAEAIIVPPQNLSIEFTKSNFDRLILTGGGDINPEVYGEDLHDKTSRVSDERDHTELNLLKIAEKNSIKTLAICRGHQLLNVYKGGTLHQDINDTFDTEIEHSYTYSEGNYGVQLYVENEFGCTDSAQVLIQIKGAEIYYVPNTFTPDGDEHNNTFQAVFTSGFDPAQFEMTIYNRWGEEIIRIIDSNDVVEP